jgi:transcriptional regulator with XRE-family HTH domain
VNDPRSTIGQRVALLRQARGLSRDELAGAIGYSGEWLKSVELGRRQLDRFSVIQALAEALGADYTDLLGRPTPTGDPATQAAHQAIPALRRTLLRAQLPNSTAGSPLPLPELRTRVNRTNRQRRHARYGNLAVDLPELLTDLAATAAATAGAQRDVANHLLAEARHNAAMMTKKLGYVDLAALAAAQALQAALASGDPLLVTAMEWTQAEVCMTAGATDEARLLVAGGLDRVEGLLTDDDLGAWSLWGTLHLVDSVIDAQRGQQAEAANALAEAAIAADRVGSAATYQTEFTAGNRAIHVVHVALELGEGREALDRVAGIDLTSLPKERRARHGIDRARAAARDGDDAQAMHEIVTADRLSPEGVRSHPLVLDMVATAARRARTLGPVAETAKRLRIPI